ncbi:MAG: hypothetical protein LJE57_07985 [Gallionella sp.]|nr:hypothetical protein [Gallionella sp.]
MKMKNWQLQIPQRYWAYLALICWGGMCLMLLNKSSYGIDEGAAQALLLTWSVVDNVVSSVVTLGFPDFRAVFLAPVGFLWTGNLLAAKIFTILVMAVATWAVHSWRRRSGETEGALLATGLLLISPLVFSQIDTISVGPFLLFTFAIGAWTDLKYRELPQAFGGRYFLQMLLSLVSVTLHPAGLAYPLALFWRWYKDPVNKKQQHYFFAGIIFTVLLALVLTMGWSHVTWLSNPVRGLSTVLQGPAGSKVLETDRWFSGIGVLAILFLIVLKQGRNLWTDFLGCIFLLALAIGMLTGDDTLGMFALVTSLYWGLPLLLQKDTEFQGGFWQQRGVVLVLFVVISTTYMMIDKSHYKAMLAGQLASSDRLIKAYVDNVENMASDRQQKNLPSGKPIRIASQWPARTMLACRCDTLPLPPAAKDEETLLAMMRGVKYLLFDPRDPANHSLSHNLAMMDAGKVETVALQRGGVIIEIKESTTTK